MNPRWKSPTGWFFVAAYFVVAGFLFHEALTCAGWVCDLIALPVVLPLGLPIEWLYDAIDYVFVLPHLTSGLMRKWYFIAPTVLANTMFYFCVGSLLEKWVRRLLRRPATRR